MSLKLVIRPAAVSDIAEAQEWYERQQTGLGGKFLDAIETALERIASRPRGYPLVLRDARRALVAKFPYSIYFRVKGDDARVLAVVHQHRDPKLWKRRLDLG